jgi:hypothetical protein
MGEVNRKLAYHPVGPLSGLRDLLARLLRRRRVPAGAGRRRGPGFPHGWEGWNGDDGDDGGAGVREPRRPRPSGPQGAGGAEPPRPPQVVRLPDARRPD